VYADYSYRAKAIELMLEYYGQQNAFRPANGKTHKVGYIIKDDGVDPVRTVPLTDELIDSEKVFAQITLGSANALKVYDELNARCIPHPLVVSGHSAWRDPVHHPWTTGLQLTYNTESVMGARSLTSTSASSHPARPRSPRCTSTVTTARSPRPSRTA
jgi:hypothetical protein